MTTRRILPTLTIALLLPHGAFAQFSDPGADNKALPTVPAGFEVKVFANEPLARPPCSMAFDDPVDQSSLEDREDVRVHSTGPLEESLTFAGTITVKLSDSTCTPDDWAEKLVDVRPDGIAINLATSILRGRYRHSRLQPELMKPGEVYEITIDLDPCAATIAKEHQLRVDICRSLFPLYDSNPNTREGIFGSQTAVATGQVHHRPGALSQIVLLVN